MRIIEWIRKRPIEAFFVITFAITWGLGFSYIAVLKHDQFLLISLASIATCGPALAGIAVSAVCNRGPKSGSARVRWVVFFVALILCTGIFLLNNVLLNQAPFSLMIVVLVLLLVVPPVAYVISGAFSRVPAVRYSLATLVNPRGAIGWALIALVLVPGLALLSILISGWLGRYANAYTGYLASGLPLVGLIAITFLYQFFFYNGTGEETGWSGFARPRLQAHFSPLITALIMTIFWAPWHVFLWYAEGRSVLNLNYWIDTIIYLIPASIVIGWFFNRSKGSIMVAGIAHAASNTAFAFLPNLDWYAFNITVSVAALVMVIIDKMWKKLPQGNSAVYSSTSMAA
jgi:membrane protease YdiL (CAAX protease family)